MDQRVQFIADYQRDVRRQRTDAFREGEARSEAAPLFKDPRARRIIEEADAMRKGE